MALIALVLLGVIILIGAALLLSLKDDGLPEPTLDHSDLGLPAGILTADDIPKLRFRTGLRGYRMEDVDAALDRIAQALRAAQPNVVQSSATPEVDQSGVDR